MKRIWFTQQKPFDYMPLRFGLGLASLREFQSWLPFQMRPTPAGVSPAEFKQCCPKTFTTRTRKMSGEYYVVEGSRFKATPVEPRIEFEVIEVFKLSLKTGWIYAVSGTCSCMGDYTALSENGLTFPELDLGYRGATFEELRDELLKLNPKATIDTPFYVHKLAPIEVSA